KGRIERIDDDVGQTSVGRELSAIAEPEAGLPAELGAEGHGVQRRPGRRLVDKVSLVEGVFARCIVLIGIQRNLRLIRRHRAATGRRRRTGAARIDVTVAAVVVGIDRAVSYGQAVAEIMVDYGHGGLHLDLGTIVDRAAKDRREIAVGRERRRGIETRRTARQSLRGIAAIRQTEVVVEFVTELDLGVVVRFQRYGRVDAVALEMAV